MNALGKSVDPVLARVAAAAFALAALLPSGALVAQSAAAPVVDRPEKLVYGPLQFDVPDAAKFRHELPGGVVAYVVPDRSLPLVNVVLNLRSGAFREPASKPGVAALTATMMRLGGTTKRTPEEFDERADFLAAQVGSSSGDTSARVSLNVLTTSLDDGLDLLFDMLRNPRFDEGRLAIEKAKALEGMKQRNDDAQDIQGREWDWLQYGFDHYSVRRTTAAQLESIGRADLADFHRRTYGVEKMVIAVSGDVDVKAIVANLTKRLAGFRAAESAPWPPAKPDFKPAPGLYHVEKDVPQGKVLIGHPGIQVTDWSSPDLASIEVMNDILGGGGFSSRIMKRVRSDEGLAYGAGSSFGTGVWWPGVFSIGYASKNPTVALAMKIAREELDKIRSAPVTAEELELDKSYIVDSFPRAFESAAQIAGTFAQDELIGRPHEYWNEYRGKIQAVTADDVLRVAKTYLHHDELVTLVVGRWDEIAPGDPQGRAKMDDLGGAGVVHLPLRDPLTLEPLPPTSAPPAN